MVTIDIKPCVMFYYLAYILSGNQYI